MESKQIRGYRLLIIGDRYSGKTSLIYRIFDKTCHEEPIPFNSKSYKIKKINNIYFEIIEFGDIYNEQKCKAIFKKNIDGILIVFDLTNKDSIGILLKIIQKINSYKIEIKTMKKLVKICVGSKADLKNEIKITKEEIVEFSTTHKKAIINVSSKCNLGIEFLKGKLIQHLTQIRNPQVLRSTDFIKSETIPNDKKEILNANTLDNGKYSKIHTDKSNYKFSNKHNACSVMASSQFETNINDAIEKKKIENNEDKKKHQDENAQLSIFEITICYEKKNISNTFSPLGENSLAYLEIFAKEYFNIPKDIPI